MTSGYDVNTLVDKISEQREKSKESRSLEDYEILADLYMDLACKGGYGDLNPVLCFAKSCGLYEELYKSTLLSSHVDKLNSISKNFFNSEYFIELIKKFDSYDINFDMFQNSIVMLSSYDILKNDDDEIMIVSPVELTGTCEPCYLYYDKGPHAILVKNGGDLVICDFLHREVRSYLYKLDDVLLCEVEMTDENAYMAKVIRAKKVKSFAEELIDISK